MGPTLDNYNKTKEAKSKKDHEYEMEKVRIKDIVVHKYYMKYDQSENEEDYKIARQIYRWDIIDVYFEKIFVGALDKLDKLTDISIEKYGDRIIDCLNEEREKQKKLAKLRKERREAQRIKQEKWDKRCKETTEALSKLLIPFQFVCRFFANIWKHIKIFGAASKEIAKSKKQGFCPYMRFTDNKDKEETA